MGLGHSPSITTNGLVMCFDAENYKSFKGTPATNILDQITYAYGNTNTATLKITNGVENVYIPALGNVTSKYVDIYNDFDGGSGDCCPALFFYGNSLAVSPNTTYTYSLIYKSRTGYSNANYMYRFEFNSSGTLLTQGGVHNTNNRISLGDGWWFAWGQFTTQSTTATLATYSFHYEYGIQNRIHVYKAALYAGTYVIPPEHMLNSGEVRGATVATGGGLANLAGGSNSGTLVNGPTYTNVNGKSLVFDAIDDTVTFPVNLTYLPALSNFSMEIWMKLNTFPTALAVANPSGFKTRAGVLFGAAYYAGVALYWYGNELGTSCNIFAYIRGLDAYRATSAYSVPATNTWIHLVLVNNYTESKLQYYINGSLYSQVAGPTQEYDSTLVLDPINAGNIGINKPQVDGGGALNYSYLPCSVSSAKIYKDKALTASEVSQNFNALRGRFGI